MLYWYVRQCIHKEVLKERRAEYGEEILPTLSAKLVCDYGQGFGAPNLARMAEHLKASITHGDEVVYRPPAPIVWDVRPIPRLWGRAGVPRGGGFLRSAARTRASTGGNGRKKTNRERLVFLHVGGDEEDRTPDLRIANATLSQLSYVPERTKF